MHPEAWKKRRESILKQHQIIYEQKIRTNSLVNSHNLLGYIDRKLMDYNGSIHVDMAQMDQGKGGNVYELEQI